MEGMDGLRWFKALAMCSFSCLLERLSGVGREGGFRFTCFFCFCFLRGYNIPNGLNVVEIDDGCQSTYRKKKGSCASACYA